MQVNALLSPTRRCTNDVLLQDLTNQLREIIHESVTIGHERHSYLRLGWLEMMLSDRYPQLSFTSHVHCICNFRKRHWRTGMLYIDQLRYEALGNAGKG